MKSPVFCGSLAAGVTDQRSHDMRELTGEAPNGNVVYFYAGEFGYFMSNFSAFAVEYDGRLWMTSEHAYQATKFEKGGSIYSVIHQAPSAHRAWELARHHKLDIRPDCDEADKLRIMDEVVRSKFGQHEYIRRKLKQTGDAWLIENAEPDSFWGRGRDWKGRNELGKIWMRLRMEKFGT